MRFVFVVVFLISSLYSSVAQKMLDEGFFLYKNGNYIRAYEKFYNLHVKNKSNIQYSIFLAKTLYQLGEYRKAKDILLPIYIKNHNDSAALYLAKIYFYEKNYAKSKKIFSGIKDRRFKKEKTKFLNKIYKKTKKHTFSTYVGLGLTYDNNIKDITYAPITIYNNTTRYNDTKTKKDLFIDKMLYIQHKYKFSNIANTAWDDYLLLYDRSGLKYSSENIFYASLKSGPAFTYKGYLLKPQILLSDMYYESEHYKYSYGLGVSIFKNINTHLSINTKMSYEKNKYIQNNDKNLNSDNFLFLFNLNQKITTTDNLKYKFQYKNINSIGNGRYDVDRKTYLCGFRYFKRLTNNYRFGLAASYKRKNYKDTDPLFGNRNDSELIYEFRLSKRVKNSYNVSFTYRHIYNSSNINVYSYKKNTFNITLSRYF